MSAPVGVSRGEPWPPKDRYVQNPGPGSSIQNARELCMREGFLQMAQRGVEGGLGPRSSSDHVPLP